MLAFKSREQRNKNQIRRRCAAAGPNAGAFRGAVGGILGLRVDVTGWSVTVRFQVMRAFTRRFGAVRASALARHQRRNAVSKMNANHQKEGDGKRTGTSWKGACARSMRSFT